jgi:hypothetical protein
LDHDANCCFGCKCLKGMAGTTGLEPATSAVTGQRSNQLNYVPYWMLRLSSNLALQAGGALSFITNASVHALQGKLYQRTCLHRDAQGISIKNAVADGGVSS